MEHMDKLYLYDIQCMFFRIFQYCNSSHNDNPFKSAHQIVTKEDYDSMQVKVATLKREIAILEKLPFDQVKEENEQLKLEHATLEAQLEQANIDYENETNQKAIMDANYADLEEALGSFLFQLITVQ